MPVLPNAQRPIAGLSNGENGKHPCFSNAKGEISGRVRRNGGIRLPAAVPTLLQKHFTGL